MEKIRVLEEDIKGLAASCIFLVALAIVMPGIINVISLEYVKN